ncbi:MAG: hypothetical protein JWO36_7044, partial [Myxococcales bacterium]|nr:hypothetical protein [Myxococcales bacterium]
GAAAGGHAGASGAAASGPAGASTVASGGAAAGGSASVSGRAGAGVAAGGSAGASSAGAVATPGLGGASGTPGAPNIDASTSGASGANVGVAGSGAVPAGATAAPSANIEGTATSATRPAGVNVDLSGSATSAAPPTGANVDVAGSATSASSGAAAGANVEGGTAGLQQPLSVSGAAMPGSPTGSVSGSRDFSVSSPESDVRSQVGDAQHATSEASAEASVYRETGADGKAAVHGGAEGIAERQVNADQFDPSGHASSVAHADKLEARNAGDLARGEAIDRSGYRDPTTEAGRVDQLEFNERDKLVSRAGVSNDSVDDVHAVANDPRGAAAAGSVHAGENLARDHAPASARDAQAQVTVTKDAIENPQLEAEGRVEVAIDPGPKVGPKKS